MEQRGSIMKQLEKLWGCVPPFIFATLDQISTLWNQTALYWSGDYRYPTESNPLARLLLQQHPFLFAVAIWGWVILFSLIIFLLPRRFAVAVSIAITLAHASATATWIAQTFESPYGILAAMFLACGIVVVVAWEKAHGAANQSKQTSS